MKNFKVSVAMILVALCITACYGAESPLNYKRVLALNSRYAVELDVDFTAKKLVAKVEVQENGFVGFGISPKGIMDGADICVGGVKDGKSYFSDYRGSPANIVEDSVKNWELMEAKENGTHTMVKFSRLFVTGDNVNDVDIKNENTFIIWSFGSTDKIEDHGPNRGNYSINFFDISKT